MELSKDIEKALEQIAMKASSTLEERGGIDRRYNDTEDFPEIYILSIQEMLKEAYILGRGAKDGITLEKLEDLDQRIADEQAKKNPDYKHLTFLTATRRRYGKVLGEDE